MEKWLLLDNEIINGEIVSYCILDNCLASNHEDAVQIFINKGWVTGNTMSEREYKGYYLGIQPEESVC